MTLGESILAAGCNYVQPTDSRIHLERQKCRAVLRGRRGFETVDFIAEKTGLPVARIPALMNVLEAVNQAESKRGAGARICWRAL